MKSKVLHGKKLHNTVLNHGRRPASRCALHRNDLGDRRYWNDRSVSLPLVFLTVLLFSQAGRPQQQAIPAINTIASVELFFRSRPNSSCMCFALNISCVLERLPSSRPFKLFIDHRFVALAADSSTSSSISRASIPALRVSVATPVSSSPRPLSADGDAPRTHQELFEASDDV